VIARLAQVVHDVERRAGRPHREVEQVSFFHAAGVFRGRLGTAPGSVARSPSSSKNPLILFAETIIRAAGVEAADGTDFAKNEVRLPFVDDYRTKCIVPRSSFRLILEAVTRLGLAA
jgi:hypothetical protein